MTENNPLYFEGCNVSIEKSAKSRGMQETCVSGCSPSATEKKGDFGDAHPQHALLRALSNVVGVDTNERIV